ncbi:unnamed protein product (macronuclear) [Paramecium tetraurelia]|uniref:Transmembrane protein n=1 Tax=Paramecium tetraurelia TaxID=5888 RepID=A0DPY7_PARTE|nr:uncharacterized protein GSPATT00002503001 [Paramecium tetraurelia]CAK85104.1 unnamed protein product [Paramecium tetraurelia]|eukprot:XP_001452501.1 hypothetical protein (macronuclear) [Paramecium tetraurelia strain d4-2]
MNYINIFPKNITRQLYDTGQYLIQKYSFYFSSPLPNSFEFFDYLIDLCLQESKFSYYYQISIQQLIIIQRKCLYRPKIQFRSNNLTLYCLEQISVSKMQFAVIREQVMVVSDFVIEGEKDLSLSLLSAVILLTKKNHQEQYQ